MSIIWWVVARFVFPPSKPVASIGYLSITDHFILGVSQQRDAANFKNFSLRSLKYSNWDILAEQLKKGELDGAFILAPLAFKLKLEGAPIQIILLGHRNGSALTVRVGNDINTAADLRGKTIGIPHLYSTHNFLLHYYLAQSGLIEGKDFATKTMPPSRMPLVLSRDEIVGYIVAEPYGAQAEVDGIGKILVFSKDIWKDHPDCVLVMRKDYITKHPQATQELVDSLVSSGNFIEKDRRQVIDIAISFLDQRREVVEKTLLDPADRVTFLDLPPKKEEFFRILDYMTKEMNLFQQPLNLDDLINNKFAPLSL